MDIIKNDDFVEADILHPEVLRELQHSCLHCMQLLSKFMQSPSTKSHFLDEVGEELDTMGEIVESAGWKADEDIPIPNIAQPAKRMNFEQLAMTTAWTGIHEMLDSVFGDTWRV